METEQRQMFDYIFEGLIRQQPSPTKGVWVHTVYYRGRKGGGKPLQIKRDFQFINQRFANRYMSFMKQRGGLKELYSVKVTNSHIHPYDPDLSDICPCG